MIEALDKAAILAEALPYIREFSGATVVIKFGGNAIHDAKGQDTAIDLFAEDVVLMRLVGMNPVVVHGGGPQISALMDRFGKKPEFVDGLRVTDAETMEIVRMALLGQVNRELVSAINRHGPFAVGVSGEDAGLLTVQTRDPRLGFVGDVTAVRPDVIHDLTRNECIPVVATLGVDDSGQVHNVNADAVAAAIAEALGAEKLVYLTNVPGIYRDFSDKTSLISEIDAAGLDALVQSGAVSEGMIPKIRSCIDAVAGGVRRAHILYGRLPHALLLEFFTRSGVGTMVMP